MYIFQCLTGYIHTCGQFESASFYLNEADKEVEREKNRMSSYYFFKVFHPVLYKEKCVFAAWDDSSSVNTEEQFGDICV